MPYACEKITTIYVHAVVDFRLAQVAQRIALGSLASCAFAESKQAFSRSTGIQASANAGELATWSK